LFSRSRFLFGALCITLLLSACGQSSQKYAASKSEGVYFTVPPSWNEISTQRLTAHEATSKEAGAAEILALVKWQLAFSPARQMSPHDIFSFVATDAPVAYARVRSLLPAEANSVSYNSLRNVIVPITQWVTNPTKETPEFNIIDDYEVVGKGARGVRTIYSFTDGGKSQTVDQTSMVSNDRQMMYIFVIRCSTQCYNKNYKVMTKISDSFTVRGAK
jgi:hypothetical protein